jgi:hypothetical protein
MVRINLALVLACLLSSSCRKVPLREAAGSISHGSVHWFENEKTAFLFFAVYELPERLIDPTFEFSWSEQTPGGGVVERALAEIDLSQAVHQHEFVQCAKGIVCGSYSFKADNPLVSAFFQFRYDRSSPLALTVNLSPTNHQAGDTANAYSALLYGVFDEKNSYTNVRVHHNFGSPSNEEVLSYGMLRKFEVSEPVLFAPEPEVITNHRETVQSPLMFPAAFCPAVTEPVSILEGETKWLATRLNPETGVSGACFNATYLDRNDQPLLSAKVSSYAFRNPEVQDSSLTFTTPLKPVNEIPVLVKICDDEPSAGAMIDNEFLNYQRFIMGIVNRPEDLCFRIGKETEFKQAFESHIAERLVNAKATNTTGADFMFLVLLHEKFSREFITLQGTIADALTTIAKTEEASVSPRLVGSFVYSGSTNFIPTASQRKSLTWCPQELLAGMFIPGLGAENCLTMRARDLDLRVINFVQPLGPFPSLENYTDYVKEYGDTGLARSPDLTFSSPQLTVNSQVEKSTNITFFDAERFSLTAGEYAKVCGDRLDPDVLSFFVRTPDQPASVPSIPLYDMNGEWLSDDADGEYRIGIQWEFPYWGGVRYNSALTGKVVTVVPFQQSFKAFEQLGDPKWVTDSWKFGKYVQKCSKYCDNPMFDEAGIYQPNNLWRTAFDDRCPLPVPPTYPGGDA